MLLWSGQTLSVFGTAITTLALPLAALSEVHASPFEVSLLSAMSTAPYFLLSLVAGAVVDRLQKRAVMAVCHIGRAISLGSVPVAALADSLTLIHLCIAGFITGAMTVFFDAAYQSYVPGLIGSRELMSANGKLSASDGLAQFAGPGIGGALVGLLGASRAIAADCISYVVAGITIICIKDNEPRRMRGGDKSTLRSEVFEGLHFVIANRPIRAIAAYNACNSVLLAGMNIVFLIYVVDILDWSAQAVGLVLGLSSAGGIVGGLIATKLVARFGMGKVLLVTALLDGPGQLPVLLVSPGLAGQIIVCSCYTFLLCGVMVYNSTQRTMRQLLCPPHLLGRMNSSVRWLQWGLAPLGAVFAGTSATLLGPSTTLLIGILGLVLSVLLLYFSPIRRIQSIPVPVSDASEDWHDLQAKQTPAP
ncbi:MFS transporter [Streptomyces sp. NPDC001834]|uniref:MFS transporter n=1 Tax=Streptomyces sp. NPDC001834 TaxID=3364616 RepID=UPI00369C04CA